MSNVRIHIQGKIVEIDKYLYLSTLQGISRNVPWVARLACEDHRNGSINANGSQQAKRLREKDEFYQALLDAIEDRQLRNYFDRLEVLEEKIMQHDTKMIEWLAAYFQIQSLTSTEQRKKFNRKLSRERQKAFDNGTGLLTWTKEPEWLKLEIEFFKITTNILSVILKIEERIARLQMQEI